MAGNLIKNDKSAEGHQDSVQALMIEFYWVCYLVSTAETGKMLLNQISHEVVWFIMECINSSMKNKKKKQVETEILYYILRGISTF